MKRQLNRFTRRVRATAYRLLSALALDFQFDDLDASEWVPQLTERADD